MKTDKKRPGNMIHENCIGEIAQVIMGEEKTP